MLSFVKFRSVSWVMLVCVLASCGPTTTEIMNSWKGSHVSRLIRSWGPPQQVTTDGVGGRIYIWTTEVNIPLTNATSKTKGTVDYNPYLDQYTIKSKTTHIAPIIIEGQRARMFWVDEDGIIYYWQAKGFVVDEGTQVVTGIVVVLGVLAIIVKYQENQRRRKFIEGLLD